MKILKKLLSVMASFMIIATPVTVLAAKSPTPHHHGGSYDSNDETTVAYNPCATSNPVLAGKGCLFVINGQVVTANGDGTFTTSAGNVFDGNGRLLYNLYGGGQSSSQVTASQYQFRFNHDIAGFIGVWVDGNYVDFNNFDYWSGSTVIQLKQSYVNTLSNGVHTLTAKWNDDVQMSTQFTVNLSKSGVPNTGESDNTAYFVMMGGALIVMAGSAYILVGNKE